MLEDQAEEIENTSSHDETAESSTVPEANAEVTAEASAAEAPAAKKPNKVQERINQLTREKHEERQKNAELEERLKTLESSQPAPAVEVAAAPKEDDFESYSDFEVARSEHIAKRAADAAYERLSQENQASKTQKEASERAQALQAKKEGFDGNVEAKRSNFEDFDEIAYGHSFMDMDLAEQIFDVEKGPEIAYHLGSNLDIAEKVFNMSPIQRARELARLEYSLEALSPNKVSNAPDPITPLGGSDTALTKSPEEMTDTEWLQWRNNQINERNKS